MNQGESQQGPRSAGSEQERRGTNETPTHTNRPQTRPRRRRLRPTSHTDTNRKPQPRRAGREQSPLPHSHHQPRSPRPNTGAPHCNLNMHKAGATHIHAHTTQPSGGGRNKAGGNVNPNAYQTSNPSQEKPGEDKSQNQARAPYDTRKPSVHRSDTEAAHAMRVAGRDEIWSPGLRLHPKPR